MVTALVLRDVHVKVGGFVILRGVNLEVPGDTIVGLVGRNGAGKTTTLRSIVGLVPVVSGSITLDGHELTRVAPHRRPALGLGYLPGYLPEDRRLIGSLTVEENLLLPVWATGRRVGADRLSLLYELMPELTALAGRRAASLSGGQQKMVSLGRAMMTSSKLLLLDEPLEGLSPVLSRRLADVIRSLRGTAVLVTESDLNRMKMMTDRIHTIERGEIARAAAGVGPK
ncbi:MAG: ATP-binding cassette domain-containing protein [Anaerolineales bacterium]